ncbi:MAG: hypothetical protein ACRDTD_18980, partial [Pseudonocardiaceae bacterium]
SQPPRPTLSPSADRRNCLVSHIRPIFGEYYGDFFQRGKPLLTFLGGAGSARHSTPYLVR